MKCSVVKLNSATYYFAYLACQFSRECNFANILIFVFFCFCVTREQIFANIWISSLTAASKFSRIQGNFLPCNSRSVLVILFAVNLIEIQYVLGVKMNWIQISNDHSCIAFISESYHVFFYP